VLGAAVAVRFGQTRCRTPTGKTFFAAMLLLDCYVAVGAEAQNQAERTGLPGQEKGQQAEDCYGMSDALHLHMW